MFTPLKDLPEGKNWTLDELNDREVQLLIPVIIYISITMVVGTVGNALVLYINIKAIKLRNSTHRYCITFLALVDFAYCVISKPFVLGVLTHPYTFTNTLACKFLRTFTYFISMVSILVLFVIAIDRYRRICKPYINQFSKRYMQRSFGVIGVISFILSIPFFVLYGKNTVQTGIANITGIQCFPDDKYKDTMFPNGYIMFLYAVFIILAASMSYLYILVWRQIRNHVNPTEKNDVSYATQTSFLSRGTSTIEKSSEGTITHTRHSIQENPISADDLGKDASEVNKENVDKKITDRSKTIRVSKILFVVTASFVFSFAPFLTLEILTFFDETFIENLDNTSTVFYQLFWRSFVINFMINPFIYGVMDIKFQMECRKLAWKISFLRTCFLRINICNV